MTIELGQKDNLLDTAELRAYYADTKLLWRNVALIGVCNLGWSVAVGITGPLMALKLLDSGVTEGSQATVGSINLWLLSFLVMYFAWKSDHTISRIGRRKPFLFISAGPIILATALFPAFNSALPLVGLWLLQIMFGNIKASTFPLLNIDCVRRDMLARAQSILSVVGGVVMFLSMRLAPFLVALNEWAPYAFGAILLMLSCVSAWWIKEPVIHNKATEIFRPWTAMKTALADRRIIWLMIGVAMIASFDHVFASWSWFWAKNTLCLDRKDIFEALSWAYLINVVIAFPTGWLIDKVGGFKIVMLYYCLMLVNLFLLLHVHDVISLRNYALIMTVVSPLNSAAEIMVFKTSDPRDVGSVTSTLSFFRNLYNGTLLFSCGWLIEITHRNYKLVFILGGFLMTIGLLMFFIYRNVMNPLSLNLVVSKADDVSARTLDVISKPIS